MATKKATVEDVMVAEAVAQGAVVEGVAENIYQAINRVMKEVGYVQKTQSKELKYSYAGEAALIAAVRPAMVREGIVVHVEDVREVAVREYATKYGTAMTNVALTGYVVFAHAPSGTTIRVAARGEGSDSGDKASNKALTGMYKYAIRQTFMIETGDDPDDTPSERYESLSDSRSVPAKAGAGAPSPSGHNGGDGFEVRGNKYIRSADPQTGEVAKSFKQAAAEWTDKEGKPYGEMTAAEMADEIIKLETFVKKYGGDPEYANNIQIANARVQALMTLRKDKLAPTGEQLGFG